jgi:hypothetical protein
VISGPSALFERGAMVAPAGSRSPRTPWPVAALMPECRDELPVTVALPSAVTSVVSTTLVPDRGNTPEVGIDGEGRLVTGG